MSAVAGGVDRRLALACGLYVAIAAAVFGVAAWLPPSPTGVGTHTAFGLPPCSFLAATGLPCPACGMTTAFAHFVRGHVWAAFLAQPFGAAMAATLAAGLVAIPVAVARGVAPDRLLEPLATRRAAVATLVLFALAWAYKVWALAG